MSLFDGIEKLITEHGSAAILRERLALAEAQHDAEVSGLTTQRDQLRTQLAEAKAKIEGLEADNARLQAERDEARNEVQRLGQIQSSRRTLPEEAEKILVLIANAQPAITKIQAVQHFQLTQVKGDYFCAHLHKRKLVRVFAKVGVGEICHVTSEGRDYLAKSELL